MILVSGSYSVNFDLKLKHYEFIGGTSIEQTKDKMRNQKYSPRQCQAIKGMGITQVVLGSLAVIFNITITALFFTKCQYDNVVISAVVAPGIWVGLFYVVTGVIGIVASSRNTYRWITSCMVLNILASSGSLAMFITPTIDLAIAGASHCDYFHTNENLFYMDVTAENTVYAMDSLILAIGLIQAAITIACSAICCNAVCCKSQRQNLLQMPRASLVHQPQPSTFSNGQSNQPVLYAVVAFQPIGYLPPSQVPAMMTQQGQGQMPNSYAMPGAPPFCPVQSGVPVSQMPGSNVEIPGVHQNQHTPFPAYGATSQPPMADDQPAECDSRDVAKLI